MGHCTYEQLALTQLYRAQNSISVINHRRERLVGHVECTWEILYIYIYNISVGKPEGMGQLAIHRLRWEDNNTTELKEVWCSVMYLINLAQDRVQWLVVNTVMNIRVG
jgi:hypothetical protein